MQLGSGGKSRGKLFLCVLNDEWQLIPGQEQQHLPLSRAHDALDKARLKPSPPEDLQEIGRGQCWPELYVLSPPAAGKLLLLHTSRVGFEIIFNVDDPEKVGQLQYASV